MIKFFEISILSLLFILNFLLDFRLYYLIIYLCLITYTIYKIYLIVRIWNEKLRFSSIAKLLLSYAISYFFICDPNPFYYMFTFYLPFQNFFKMAFLIAFISYRVEKLSTRDMEKYLISFLNNSETIDESNLTDSAIDINEENKKQDNDNNKGEDDTDDKIKLQNSEENNKEKSNKYKNKFFLSEFIFQFKRIKNIFLFILITSIIQFSLFLYRVKFWINFNSKERALPIATAANTKFYIASCICNMGPKIEDYIDEMKKLINYLGPENVMVSIIENGDSKDATRDYLIEYQKYLNDSKIINEISMEHEVCKVNATWNSYTRIDFLYRLRNRAFNLMYNTSNFDYQNTKVIYINDIIYTYEDIIKLLATNNEDYDAVCAMDFNIYYYDTWASADLNGNSIRHVFPYFINPEAQDQVVNIKPVRIFSCWGGAFIFPAAPLENKKLQFRTEPSTKEFKYTLNNYQVGNTESECTYINIDLQSLGYTKRFVNPDVKVAYVYKYYYITKYFGELYHFAQYFYQYFWKFTEKRNKNMSNLRDKFVKLEKRIELWYNHHKLNYTKEVEE